MSDSVDPTHSVFLILVIRIVTVSRKSLAATGLNILTPYLTIDWLSMGWQLFCLK
jgi:hypothetical protein